MTPEKQTKSPNSNKQKIMIGVIVVIALVGIWQFMGTGSSSGTPSPAPSSAAAKPGSNMATPATNMSANGPASVPPPVMNQPKAVPVPVNNEIAKLQGQAQAEYVSSLSKLQILKLQKEIDETKTAIAAAELNRMTAEKSIADLITSKQEPIAAPPASTTAPATAALPPVMLSPPEFNYTVYSVSYSGHKWAAVIGGNNKTYSVSVGDTLQPDGSKVISIDKQGVVLKRNQTTRILSVTSSI